MSMYEGNRMDWQPWAIKWAGSLFGVALSMVFVAPANTKNTLYRILLGPVAGVIFAPAVQNVFWFLRGDGPEYLLASACAAGFTTWFIMEYVARMMSSRQWLERLLDEVLRLRGDRK